MQYIPTSENLNGGKKFLIVLLSAFMTGALWRMRGEHGWGSSWGLLMVGLVFTMLVYAVFGYRKKASMGYLTATAAAFMLTPPAWGPILTQITGTVAEQEKDGGIITYSVSPLSGVIFMLCLGFGMACLFAFMLGRFFSDKEYKWYHFVSVVAVYLIIEYAAKASVSHIIVAAVQPESCKMFSMALAEKGESGSLLQVYLHHFNDMAWAKKISGGRNYYSEIEIVSRAIGAAAMLIAVRFGLKDKIGGRIMGAVLASFAFAITAADIIFYVGCGGYHRTQFSTENFFSNGTWSMWEYATGFIAGGLIMAAFMLIPRRTLEQSKSLQDETNPFLKGKPRDIAGMIFIYAFGFCASLIRPVAERLDGSDALYYSAYGVLGAAAIVIGILMLCGKLPAIWKAEVQQFCVKNFHLYFLALIWIYFYSGLWNPDASAEYTVANFLGVKNFVWWLMIISSAAVMVLYYAVFVQKRDKKK